MTHGREQGAIVAGHTVLEVMTAAPLLSRILVAPVDQPHVLRILTTLDDEAVTNVECVLYFRDISTKEARLNSDYVVPIDEIGSSDGHPFLIRPLLPSVTLETLFEARAKDPRALPAAVGATIVRGVLNGLIDALDGDLHHTALRPSAVLVDSAGDVRVEGFTEGMLLSRFQPLGRAPKNDAPEVRRGREPTAQTDCYGVASILYRLLTGAVQPDEWEPQWTGMMMQLASAGVPGEALKRGVDFFHRALAERPEQRYADVRKVEFAFRPLEQELESPKPRQVVAELVAPFLPLVPDYSSVTSGLNASTSRLPESTKLTHLERTHYDRHEDIPRIKSEDLAVVGDSERQTTGTGEGPRATRILFNSSGSLRALSPELREQIGPHPLEILARSRYQVLGDLGTGGTGNVYKVLDSTLSEILALKVLRGDLVNDPAWLQRFKRELLITRDLEHPHILPAYHLELLDGLYFFTMKYVDGVTLHDLLQRNGPLNLDEGLRVLGPVGEALAAAHDRGIVHRDFKSANIMIERVTQVPYLMDFGIALTADNPGLTVTGQGIGTPVYMAPEQAMGEEIGRRADIYSFGVVLYEVFSGTLPFTGSTTVAVYTAQINRRYKPLVNLVSTPVAKLSELIDHCLQPNPADRPSDMKAVLTTLVAACS